MNKTIDYSLIKMINLQVVKSRIFRVFIYDFWGLKHLCLTIEDAKR